MEAVAPGEAGTTSEQPDLQMSKELNDDSPKKLFSTVSDKEPWLPKDANLIKHRN